MPGDREQPRKTGHGKGVARGSQERADGEGEEAVEGPDGCGEVVRRRAPRLHRLHQQIHGKKDLLVCGGTGRGAQRAPEVTDRR